MDEERGLHVTILRVDETLTRGLEENEYRSSACLVCGIVFGCKLGKIVYRIYCSIIQLIIGLTHPLPYLRAVLIYVFILITHQ